MACNDVQWRASAHDAGMPNTKTMPLFHWLALLILVSITEAFPKSIPLASVNASRIAWLDVNVGQYIFVSKHSEGRSGPGIEWAVNPGLASASLLIGAGNHQYGSNYAGFHGGFSGYLLVGRTYFLDSIYRKDTFFYGTQLKLELFFVILRAGLLYNEKEKFGLNAGLGIGI